MHDLTTPLFDPFASEEISPAFSSQWEAKRRLARAARELTERLVTSAAPESLLDEVTAALQDLNRRLAQAPACRGSLAFLQSGDHGGYAQINHELNALGGQSNPLAPGLNMWLEGNRARGVVNCGYAYEGPPGFVHGGFVAAIFDQFLGMAQVAGGQPGMTGSLTVRYLRPTPLNTDLELEATVSPMEGRKTVVSGEIRAGDRVTATAEGLFVRPRRGMESLGQ